MTTPPANIAMPPAPGAGATGMAPSGMVPSSAAMAALTTLVAAPSYVQPLTPTMGGLLQSTYGEFEPWMEEDTFMTGLDSIQLDMDEEVQITESASSYKLQWSSEKLQLSSKGIEDYV